MKRRTFVGSIFAGLASARSSFASQGASLEAQSGRHSDPCFRKNWRSAHDHRAGRRSFSSDFEGRGQGDCEKSL